MKRSSIVILIIVLFSCTDKSIDIEVIQNECKRFKIESPSYELIEDPCLSGVKLKAKVKFGFSRSADCLNQLKNSPVFYAADNSTLNPKAYSALLSKPQLIISDNTVEYLFEVEFLDETAAKQLNHIVLDFNTQDELGVSSNTLQIRINTSCSTVDPNSYNLNKNSVTIPRTQNVFTIRLWDNAAEDGDIVSVYLNGNWLIENHTLTKAGHAFSFDTALLNHGANDLVVFALNEGSSGPNTVSIAVNGNEIPNFKPGLTTGEAVRIDF